MNSNQLRCIINCDHELRHFISGVFARDQIPQYINQSCCGFISNTDKSQDKGQHWVAFYVTSSTTGFFFDSYGNHPAFYAKEFEDFFTRNGLTLQYNNIRLQSYNSNVCGHYVCLYLLLQSRNIPIQQMLRLFNEHHTSNDIFVHDFIHNAFSCCLNHDQVGQLCSPGMFYLPSLK